MALLHKYRTGKGQLVDACLFRSGLYILGCPLMMAAGDEASSGTNERCPLGPLKRYCNPV